MTTKAQADTVDDSKLILELQIDAAGNVTSTSSSTEKKDTLEGTLLAQMYPGIRVARVSVPDELTNYEQSIVENTMATLKYEGVDYRIVGASGAGKEGRFYFVDAAHAEPIARRFRHWPQAAIVYFSILMTDCKVVIEQPHRRILVVQDNILGTNDCRGWIRESLYELTRQPKDRFVQFRLGFHELNPKQAKGGLKPLSDEISDLLGVDMIIPISSIKPGLDVPLRFIPGIGVPGLLFHGPIVLGIKAVSRESEYQSSYTLLGYAPKESLRSEILPLAFEQAHKVKNAFTEGNYAGLFEVMGRYSPWTSGSSVSESRDGEGEDEVADEVREVQELDDEWDPVEAALVADRYGMVVHIPYVANHMDRRLARWAFRLRSGGGFRLPSFALMDDGVIFAHEGKVYSASDWIPKDTAITHLTCDLSLCVRYPIRMMEDLLPVTHLSDVQLSKLLKASVGLTKLPDEVVANVIKTQLRIEGTYVLHSRTAAQNGGDFDFDTICAIGSDRFPKFVEARLRYGNRFEQEKQKQKKAESPWWNMPAVAMKARGNKIGRITDLKTSCLAAGRLDLQNRCVSLLQSALDALKHNVEVDEGEIEAIQKEVKPAAWLKYKRERRVSDIPMTLEVLETDVVGELFNMVGPEIGELLAEQRQISDFRGLFRGQSFTKEMFDECAIVNAIYGSNAALVIKRLNAKKEALKKAQAELDAVRENGTREQKKAAMSARKRAQSALKADEIKSRSELSFLNKILQRWAKGKIENRRAWAHAMAAVVTGGTGSGGVLFNTFPQEFCDLLAEQTGGTKVRVRMPRLPHGHIEVVDRKLYSVYPYTNSDGSTGQHEALIAEYVGNDSFDFSESVLHQ